MSLGIGVDVVKAAVEKASIVIAQTNSMMPHIRGDGLINIDDVDFIVPRDESLLEYNNTVGATDEVYQRIGMHVARLIEDGSTIQVGYGRLPNYILSNLMNKMGYEVIVKDGGSYSMKLTFK